MLTFPQPHPLGAQKHLRSGLASLLRKWALRETWVSRQELQGEVRSGSSLPPARPSGPVLSLLQPKQQPQVMECLLCSLLMKSKANSKKQ